MWSIQPLVTAISGAWRSLRAWRPFDARYRVRLVEDLPDPLERRRLYVVGDPGFPLYAAMACPKKQCNTQLTMNLAPDDAPQWRLALDAGDLPTLSPSIWRKTACGCHFFLRRGQLEWCQ